MLFWDAVIAAQMAFRLSNHSSIKREAIKEIMKFSHRIEYYLPFLICFFLGDEAIIQ